MALARLLLCSQPDAGLNCGRCKSCALTASGSHSDFRWLQPEGKSQIIKVDQVRAAIDFLSRTAALGQHKVVVIQPADRMNANAANALLKALEEPAAGSYLVLVCDRFYGLPATVRSRCQVLNVGVPEVDLALSWLTRLTGDHEQSQRLLSLANGRPLLAEKIYREDTEKILAARRQSVHQLLLGEVTAQVALAAVAEAPVEDTLELLLSLLADLLKSLPRALIAGAAGKSNFALIDEVKRLRQMLLAGANPNGQLLLEALLGRVQRELGSLHLGDTMRGERSNAYE